jgi:trans-aconitate methyltransferase
MKYLKKIYEFKLSNNPIPNINIYIDNMNKGLNDKLFFINKVNIDTLVDFGCADGTLLNEIHKINPNINLIGYDIDYNMMKISKNKYPNIDFYFDWNDVINNINNENINALLLSSVIHEVYSYGTSKEIKKFWKQIFNENFKYYY